MLTLIPALKKQWVSVSLRPAMFIEPIPGQPGLHRRTWKKKKKSLAWWPLFKVPLILALQRQRQGEISVHLRPAWSTLGVLGHPRLHNEKMERKKNSFC